MPVVFTLLLTISLYAALLTDAIGEKPLSSVGDNPGADGSRSIFSSSAETAWPVGIEKITNLSYSSGSRESYQSPNSLRSNEDLEIARDSEIAVGELRALLAKHSIDRRLEPGPLLPSENQFLSETILDQPLKILRISAYRDEPNVRAVDPRSANYDDVFAFEPKAKGDGQLLTPDNSPKNASAALFPLGEAKLLPTSNFFGRAVFIYFLGNSDGANPWVRAQVTNAEANIDPTAVDDEFSLLRNEILEISTTALTDNDIEPNGDDLLVSSTRNAQNGTVFFVGDFIRFEPTFDFVGTASFEYVLTDNNGGSAIGSVFINYSELNNPPVAASDSLEGVEDSTLDIPISVLLENDFDPEGDPLAISSVQNIAGGIPNLVNSDTVQFVPSVNFFGNASFSYWVTDGESETRAEVTIDIASVNDPPVALNDSFHTGIDVPLAIPASDLLSNDYDVDGDPIGIVSVAGSRNGATSLDEFGSVQFVPDDSFTGIAEFSYQVEDGEGGRASAQVIIDVGKQFAWLPLYGTSLHRIDKAEW